MVNLQKFNTTGELATAVRNNPELAKLIKDDPVKVLDEVSSGRIPDTNVYRIVVISLGTAVLLALVGAIAIALVQQTNQIPDILVAVASAAVGALAGLLAPQPGNG